MLTESVNECGERCDKCMISGDKNYGKYKCSEDCDSCADYTDELPADYNDPNTCQAKPADVFVRRVFSIQQKFYRLCYIVHNPEEFYLSSFLYLIRCGLQASSPRRAFLSFS